MSTLSGKQQDSYIIVKCKSQALFEHNSNIISSDARTMCISYVYSPSVLLKVVYSCVFTFCVVAHI